ncbi:MAG: NAD-dependent deacylase [Anaerolineae bacterium]|nr:NAD-dependent deacylase [Anaerolineae bacterium]
MYEVAIQRAAALLHASKHAIALTGAGVSTPSGVPDFRSVGSGLWARHNPLEKASLVSFRRDPNAFYAWLRPLARAMCQAEPNPAHRALARLEAMGVLKALITQNIDNLHRMAGSRVVHEVHGHFRTATCVSCYAECEVGPFLDAFLQHGLAPACPDCGGVLKPNVILLGEQLPVETFSAASQAVRACDVMVVAGSSLEVAPVGGLPRLAAFHGARLILVNDQDTQVDGLADVVIHANVAEVLPRIVDALQC